MKDTRFSENNNINGDKYKFILIKEADEESDDFFRDDDEEEDDDSRYRAADGGSLKKTSYRDNIKGKSYFQIKQASSASEASFYGWNDIVEGIKGTLLNRNFGANDAQQEDIAKAIENFESIHDKIVDYFFKNATSEKLYSSSGRRYRASSEVAKSSGAGKLQRGNAETESQNRKLRTSKNIMPVRDLVAGDNEVDPKTIEPLTYYPSDSQYKEKREQFLLVFFDTSKQKKFEHPTKKDSNGKPMMFIPDLTFNKDEHPMPYVFREDLRSYLNNSSNAIRYISENKDKLNNSNYDLLVGILDKEKTNLLSYWKDIFPKITPKYESYEELKYGKEGEIKGYIGDKYNSIYNKIEEVYNTQKEELNNIVKTNVQKIPETSAEAQIEAGYNDLKQIVKEIEKIIEDEDYNGSKIIFQKENKENKERQTIINWITAINMLKKTLVESKDTSESLINVILRHMGGWSPIGERLHKKEIEDAKNELRKNGIEPSSDEDILFQQLASKKIKIPSTNPLKHSADKFLNKIFNNFNKCGELLKIWAKMAKPAAEDAESTNVRNNSVAVSRQLGFYFNEIKSEFIKQSK